MQKPQRDEQDLKQLISEHEQLRREILHNETIIMQTLTATISIVAIVMGLAFSIAVKDLAVKSFLFFFSESVAMIAMLQSTDKGRHTFLIASYLRLFTEAELHHLKWETRLLEFRKSNPELGYSSLIGNHLWIYTSIAVVDFVLGSGYAIESFKNSTVLHTVIGLLVLILCVTTLRIRDAWILYSKYVRNHRETFENKWMEVKKSEDKNKRLVERSYNSRG